MTEDLAPESANLLLGALGLRSSLLLLGGLLLAALLGRASASTRQWCWRVTFAALLALPVLGAALPATALISVPWLSGFLGSPSVVEWVVGTEPAGPERLAAQIHDLSPTAVSAPASSGLLLWLPLALYLTGVGLLLARWLHGSYHLRSEQLHPCPSEVAARFEHHRQRMRRNSSGSRRALGRAVIRVGARECAPRVQGVLTPTLVLPPSVVEWSLPELDAVLLHETAHITRRDVLWLHLGAMVRAIHWFNPLVWLAQRHSTALAERACDDAAIAGGVPATVYGRALLELSRRWTRSQRLAPFTSLAMSGGRPALSRRIAALLDARRRDQPSAATRILIALVVLTASLAVAAARPAAPLADSPPIEIEARIVEGTALLDLSRASRESALAADLGPALLELGVSALDDRLDAMLVELTERGILDLLSAPKIVTLSGETAAIQSGLSASDTGPSRVLRINLTPTALDGGRLALEVELRLGSYTVGESPEAGLEGANRIRRQLELLDGDEILLISGLEDRTPIGVFLRVGRTDGNASNR